MRFVLKPSLNTLLTLMCVFKHLTTLFVLVCVVWSCAELVSADSEKQTLKPTQEASPAKAKYAAARYRSQPLCQQHVPFVCASLVGASEYIVDKEWEKARANAIGEVRVGFDEGESQWRKRISAPLASLQFTSETCYYVPLEATYFKLQRLNLTAEACLKAKQVLQVSIPQIAEATYHFRGARSAFYKFTTQDSHVVPTSLPIIAAETNSSDLYPTLYSYSSDGSSYLSIDRSYYMCKNTTSSEAFKREPDIRCPGAALQRVVRLYRQDRSIFSKLRSIQVSRRKWTLEGLARSPATIMTFADEHQHNVLEFQHRSIASFDWTILQVRNVVKNNFSIYVSSLASSAIDAEEDASFKKFKIELYVSSTDKASGIVAVVLSNKVLQEQSKNAKCANSCFLHFNFDQAVHFQLSAAMFNTVTFKSLAKLPMIKNLPSEPIVILYFPGSNCTGNYSVNAFSYTGYAHKEHGKPKVVQIGKDEYCERVFIRHWLEGTGTAVIVHQTEGYRISPNVPNIDAVLPAEVSIALDKRILCGSQATYMCVAPKNQTWRDLSASRSATLVKKGKDYDSRVFSMFTLFPPKKPKCFPEHCFLLSQPVLKSSLGMDLDLGVGDACDGSFDLRYNFQDLWGEAHIYLRQVPVVRFPNNSFRQMFLKPAPAFFMVDSSNSWLKDNQYAVASTGGNYGFQSYMNDLVLYTYGIDPNSPKVVSKAAVTTSLITSRSPMELDSSDHVMFYRFKSVDSFPFTWRVPLRSITDQSLLQLCFKIEGGSTLVIDDINQYIEMFEVSFGEDKSNSLENVVLKKVNDYLCLVIKPDPILGKFVPYNKKQLLYATFDIDVVFKKNVKPLGLASAYLSDIGVVNSLKDISWKFCSVICKNHCSRELCLFLAEMILLTKN